MDMAAISPTVNPWYNIKFCNSILLGCHNAYQVELSRIPVLCAIDGQVDVGVVVSARANIVQCDTHLSGVN